MCGLLVVFRSSVTPDPTTGPALRGISSSSASFMLQDREAPKELEPAPAAEDAR